MNEVFDTVLWHFASLQCLGGWFDTADHAEQQLWTADPQDGATPSGASSIAKKLLNVAQLILRAERYLLAAENTLNVHSVLLARAALGQVLAGGGRIRGAWTTADRGRLRPCVVAPADRRVLADARQRDRRW
nr:hypothetical protein [Mycobacterium uberis]